MESVSLVHKQEEREQRSLDKLTRHPQKACNDPTGGGEREQLRNRKAINTDRAGKVIISRRFPLVKSGLGNKNRDSARAVPETHATETAAPREIRSICRVPPLLAASPRVNLSMNYDCSRGRSFTPRKKLLPQRGSISMIVRIVRITKPLFPRVWELSLMSSCYLFIFSSLLKIIELERSCRGIIFRYSWKRLIN